MESTPNCHFSGFSGDFQVEEQEVDQAMSPLKSQQSPALYYLMREDVENLLKVPKDALRSLSAISTAHFSKYSDDVLNVVDNILKVFWLDCRKFK